MSSDLSPFFGTSNGAIFRSKIQDRKAGCAVGTKFGPSSWPENGSVRMSFLATAASRCGPALESAGRVGWTHHLRFRRRSVFPAQQSLAPVIALLSSVSVPTHTHFLDTRALEYSCQPTANACQNWIGPFYNACVCTTLLPSRGALAQH